MHSLPANFRTFASRNQPTMVLLAVAFWCAPVSVAQETTAEIASGKSVFQAKCASCHGADGQGDTQGYDQPLQGELSVASLALQIEQTMPQDDPDACVGPEARRVATYVHDEFYSYGARLRKGLIRPPRVELMRLTVRQYQNMIADLLGHFTPLAWDSADKGEPGLRAEYYESEGMNKANELKWEKVDPQIDFDFGTASPREGIAADQFSVIWEGSVFATETGFYEFRIRTENGARLYVNSDSPEQRRKLRDDSSAAGQAALIDAWVSSGTMRERSARVFLLGGRFYPLRLEFFKYKEATASLRLEWQPPAGIWTVLDNRFLTTKRSGRTFAIDVPFPADDRSLGYERGSSVSKGWQLAAKNGAVATSAEVVDRLALLAGRSRDEANRDELVQFVQDFAAVAFRRPLSDEEYLQLRELMYQSAPRADVALRRSLLLVLQSPHFLYANLPYSESHGAEAVAAQLALVLWDSLPDKELAGPVAASHMRNELAMEELARVMLDDPRTRAKLMQFFHEWLGIGERDLVKDSAHFPMFDAQVVDDLRYSLDQLIDEVVWGPGSDFRKLLLADYLPLNSRLRQLYGSDQDLASQSAVAANQFVPVRLKEPRAGLLTHPYMLSALAYHDSTSPIHRGVFLSRNIVGRALKPPPIAVSFDNAKFPIGLSMREKITQLTQDRACMSCHAVINPLGYALENYDPVGRWRTSDNTHPVDSRSEYVTDDGERIWFDDARDIAQYAITNESAQRAFVTHLFRYFVKQNPDAFGEATIEGLRRRFVTNDYNIQDLIVHVAMTVATSKSQTGRISP